MLLLVNFQQRFYSPQFLDEGRKAIPTLACSREEVLEQVQHDHEQWTASIIWLDIWEAQKANGENSLPGSPNVKGAIEGSKHKF